MKVGIVTFHDAKNYGAAWQSFALQEVLKKLTCEPEFIQFSIKLEEKNNNQASLERMKKFARLMEQREKMQTLHNKRKLLFKDFANNYLNVSKPYNDDTLIDEAYDMFFVGSDQVWNYEIIKDDTHYFLDFAKAHKRFAYAASFGLENLPNSLIGWYKKHLAGFTAISVREISGVSLAKELTTKEITLCLDPTLLLNPQEWKDILKNHKPERKQGYVLLYIINPDAQLIKKAHHRATTMGLELKIVTACLIPQLGEETWTETGVMDLLAAMRDAHIIFTDSFHALVFALTFHKPFMLGQMGLTSTRSSRLRNLLDLTKIRLEHEQLADNIDWSVVDSSINTQRESSINYIKQCIQTINI